MVKANTNRTIKAIFQKKYWDGSDAGRILLYNAARARYQQKKDKEPTPVYPPDAFKARVDALPAFERLHYRMYEALNDVIGRFVASYGLYRMSLYYDLLLYQKNIEELDAKDEAKQDVADAPVIMTQKQFDREYAQAKREYKSIPVSYYDLIMLEITDAFKRKDSGVLIDTVLDELEPLRNEKATDEVMLRQYNRLSDRGYYTIPSTGLRSDQTDPQTWEDAVKNIVSKIAARIIKLEMGQRSVPAAQRSALGMIARNRRYRGLELLYNGGEAILTAIRENIKGRKDTDHKGRPITAEEIEYLLAKVIDTLPIQAIYLASPGTTEFDHIEKHMAEDLANLIIYDGSAPVWHYYEDAPAFVSKYDLLIHSMPMYATTDGDYFYGGEREKANAFKKEFPKLYEAALREVERKTGIPADDADVTRLMIRLGTLRKNKRFNQTLLNVFESKKPELLKEIERRSIAILDEELANPRNIDGRGNYKARLSTVREWREVLLKLENGDDDEDTPRDVLQQNIMPDAAGYFAYNQMIDLFSQVTDIPLLTVFKSDTDELMEAAKEVNKKIFMLIYKTYGGTRSDAAKRAHFRYRVRRIFKPINLHLYNATYNELEPIRDELEQFIRPPHIYKGGKVIPTATVGQINIGFFNMAYKLRDAIESRCNEQ